MRPFVSGLFDRLVSNDEAAWPGRPVSRAEALARCKASITRDLIALLNTRCALASHDLTDFPGVASSILTYGLVDFAGMCMTSDIDQQRICAAVRAAIERHEPRLRKVEVSLRKGRGNINRVEFEIAARVEGFDDAEALAFNAAFRPSEQKYSIDDF